MSSALDKLAGNMEQAYMARMAEMEKQRDEETKKRIKLEAENRELRNRLQKQEATNAAGASLTKLIEAELH